MSGTRDERSIGVFVIQNSVIDDHARELGVAGLAVYSLIARYADETTATYATMTKVLGISRKTCARAVRTLIKLGLVELTRSPEGKAVYTLRSSAGEPRGAGSGEELAPTSRC